MKNFKSLSLAVITMAAASFVFSSCSFDDIFREKGSDANKAVLLEVTADNGFDTKSGGKVQQFDPIDLSTEEIPFFLSLNMSPFNEDVFGQNVDTKGQVITTGGVDTTRTTFRVDVFNQKKVYEALDGTKSNTASYNSVWALDHQVNWPDDKSALDFWAISYPGTYDVTLGNGDKDQVQFSYTGPGSKGVINNNAGESLTDFLVAYSPNKTQNKVPIHFYHALSAIRFNVAKDFINGNDDHPAYQGVKVRISGVRKDGTFYYVGNGAFNEANGNFDWTPNDTTKVDYQQTLFDTTNGEYSQDARTFFFIPQNLSGMLLTFYITNNKGKEYVLSTRNLGIDTWKAGYIYNYTIGNDVYGSVGVEVREDPFDQEVKNNVRIGLTSSAASYIRVAVIANWYTTGKTSNKVYAPYDLTDLEYDTDKWALSPYDGYYYYRHPILGYTETDVFIDDFRATGAEPDSPFNLHVEMNIIAQAVTRDERYNDPYYTAAWAWFNKNTAEAAAEDSDAIAWFKSNVSSEIE